MNIEPDIFDYLETTSLEPHDDYTSEITYKDQKIIWNKLKEKEKEIERLKEEYIMLQNASDEVEDELQQRIDEAIEYVEEKLIYRYDEDIVIDLLDILQGSDKN